MSTMTPPPEASLAPPPHTPVSLELLREAEDQRRQKYLHLAQSIGLCAPSKELPVPETVQDATLVDQVLAAEFEQMSLEEQERMQLQLYGFDTPTLLLDPSSPEATAAVAATPTTASAAGASAPRASFTSASSTSSTTTTNSEAASSSADYDGSTSTTQQTKTHNQHLEQLFQQFEELLQQKVAAGDASTRAYACAYYWNPEYCTDRKLRLHFLRTEQWSIPKAVNLFLYHFAIKQQLFVPSPANSNNCSSNSSSSNNTPHAILGRRIQWSDLSADDQTSIQAGFFQVSKFADAAGRTVLYWSPAHRKFQTLQNLQRAMWYIGMSMLQEEEREHELGVVVVLSFYRSEGISIPNMLKLRQVRLALPFVIAGVHICYSGSPTMKPLVATIRLYQHCNPKRAILRVHEGTPEETFSALHLFGIDSCPFSRNNLDGGGGPALSTEWHLQWLDCLQVKEQNTQLADPAADDMRPRRFDVLFGKGKESLQHPGTLRCIHLVNTFQEKYESASRRAKTVVADQIWDIITASHGRFLKRVAKDGPWVEVDKPTAREKISHFFRQKRNVVPSRRTESASLALPGRNCTQDEGHTLKGGGGGADNDGGGWQTVTSSDKKRVMRKNRQSLHQRGVAHPTAASHEAINDVATLERIVETCREALRQTTLYRRLLRGVNVEVAFEEILCYGIGNFSKTHPRYFSPSLWQLACLLQLRDDLVASARQVEPSDSMQEDHPHCAVSKPTVYFFDPVCTAMEKEFLISQNVAVLDQDNQGKRRIPLASLIFMPHCPAFLYDNLLATNPECLIPGSPTRLIGNSLQNFCDSMSLQCRVDALEARVHLLEEECLPVDAQQPSEFEKAFNDTYIIRGGNPNI